MPSPPLQWWITAAVLVALELGSGSFYLLMLALGAAAGALAALVGAGSVAVLYLIRKRRKPRPPQANRDVNLDIGSLVDVAAWDQAGQATVRWRGAEWQARLGRGQPVAGRFRIAALDGNTLVLDAEHETPPRGGGQ